jgi:hypothetical protein
LNGRNYILDFSMGDRPWQVPDFNPATVSRQYTGLRISNGIRAGQTVISAAVRFEFTSLRDIAAFGLSDRTQTMISAFPPGNMPASSLNAALTLLRKASTAAASDTMRLMVAELYSQLGERAISSGQTAIALSAGTEGSAAFGLLPVTTRTGRRALQYSLGLLVARANERGGASGRVAALSQFAALANLDPVREDAYDGIHRLRISRFNSAHAARRRADAQAELDALAAVLRQGIKAAGSDLAMETNLQSKLDSIMDGARARGYRVP